MNNKRLYRRCLIYKQEKNSSSVVINIYSRMHAYIISSLGYEMFKSIKAQINVVSDTRKEFTFGSFSIVNID